MPIVLPLTPLAPPPPPPPLLPLSPQELAELAAAAAACPDGPLAFAVRRRLLPLLRTALAAGAYPDRCDRSGRTPLALAAAKGNAAAVRALLQAGACADQQDALLAAAFNGHAAVVQLLLEHGAPVNAQDADGWSACILAAGRGHAAVVCLLASAGGQGMGAGCGGAQLPPPCCHCRCCSSGGKLQ